MSIFAPGFKALALAAIASATVTGLTLAPAAAAERPNFVVIQTDDESPWLLKSRYRGDGKGFHRTMPNTLRHIVRNGAEFRNYYATSPVCSPSRASLLTGQYPRNNGLITNEGDVGGWGGWKSLPIQMNNLPKTLQDSGYRTAHFGKFINRYYNPRTGGAAREVPAGWSRWFTTSFRSRENRFYGYSVNVDGQPQRNFGDANYKAEGDSVDPPSCNLSSRRAGKPGAGGNRQRCKYLTDVMTREAVTELERRHDEPFYLQIDYESPHGDVRPPVGPQPATRHIGSAKRTPMPARPNFNEADVSDKPDRIREFISRRLGPAARKKIGIAYRRQLEAQRSVDEGVGEIIRTLRRTGELDNTYIFYLSDHGAFLGEHRFSLAKFLPYEESARVSMAVRGPGIQPGTKSNEVVGNIDIPATIFGLARAKPGYEVDGRSLRRLWRNPDRRSRRPLEISLRRPSGTGPEPATARAGTSAVAGKAPSLRYVGYRVGPYKFIRYGTGEIELYDLGRDPFELENRAEDARYSGVVRYMRSNLSGVIDCTGSDCRQGLPPWPQPGAAPVG